jgi:hypothetical protein
MIARLQLGPNKHMQTMLVLAGIRTPATKRTTAEGKNVEASLSGLKHIVSSSRGCIFERLMSSCWA